MGVCLPCASVLLSMEYPQTPIWSLKWHRVLIRLPGLMIHNDGLTPLFGAMRKSGYHDGNIGFSFLCSRKPGTEHITIPQREQIGGMRGRKQHRHVSLV